MRQVTTIDFLHKDLIDCSPLDDDAINSGIKTLKSKQLYRYNCEGAEGSEVALLEKELAQALGVHYSLAVNSCTSALFLALVSSGLMPGDNVLLPAFTFVAVPSAVILAGGVPVLVECSHSYCVMLDDLELKMQRGAKYLMLSYMRGKVKQLDKIIQLTKKYNVILIEDAAHAVGVKWNNQALGTFGVASAFSFQSSKMMNAGDGGLFATDDEALMAKAILYSGAYEQMHLKHFISPEVFKPYLKKVPHYNFRMSNLSASILRTQVPKIESLRAGYNRKYEKLVEILSRSSYITVPPDEACVTYLHDSIQFYMAHLTTAQLLKFNEAAQQRNIPTCVMGLQENNSRCFWNWHFIDEEFCLPKTKSMLMSSCDLRLPRYLTLEHIEVLGQAILECVEHALKA